MKTRNQIKAKAMLTTSNSSILPNRVKIQLPAKVITARSSIESQLTQSNTNNATRQAFPFNLPKFAEVRKVHHSVHVTQKDGHTTNPQDFERTSQEITNINIAIRSPDSQNVSKTIQNFHKSPKVIGMGN
jgi:hypothetical protein